MDNIGGRVTQPINYEETISFGVTGQVYQGAGYPVPPGATVRVLGANQTDAGNAHIAFIGKSPDQAKSGAGMTVRSGFEHVYPVTNTAQIYASGTAGDGIVISVKANQPG